MRPLRLKPAPTYLADHRNGPGGLHSPGNWHCLRFRCGGFDLREKMPGMPVGILAIIVVDFDPGVPAVRLRRLALDHAVGAPDREVFGDGQYRRDGWGHANAPELGVTRVTGRNGPW